MFKKKDKSQKEPVEIPGWTEAPYSIIATELAGHGLAESWDKQLKESNPVELVQVLEKLPVKAGDAVTLARRSWVLASAYRKVHKRLQQAIQDQRKAEQAQLEAEGRSLMLECSGKLLKDKLTHYQAIAENSAVYIAANKYKHRRGRVNRNKVHRHIAAASVDWDPSRWDGDVWESDSDDWDDCPGGPDCPDPVIDPPRARALPVTRRKQETKYGPDYQAARDAQGQKIPTKNQEGQILNVDGGVWDGEPQDIQYERELVPHTEVKESLQDFSQSEVDDILNRFRQRSGENDMRWLVRLLDTGATGVTLDQGDIHKFLTLTRDTVITRVMKHWFNNKGGGESITLAGVVVQGLREKYPTEGDIPFNDKPWFAIKDGIERVKEEIARTSLHSLEVRDPYLTPITAGFRSRLLKSTPAAYRAVMMTLLLSLMDQPAYLLIDRMAEIQELGDWGGNKGGEERSRDRPPPKNPQYGGNRTKTEGGNDRVSRRDMFTALLKAGVSKEKIDGIDTGKMWGMYKQKVLGKQVSKTDGIPKEDKKQKVTKKAQTEEGKPRPPGWEQYKDLYPWEEMAAVMSAHLKSRTATAPPPEDGEDSE